MKKLLICVLTVISLNASAQLTKEIVEKEFPILEFPYDTRGMLATSYNDKEPFDPTKSRFAKADVSVVIKKYLNTNLLINENAKQYAIGRLTVANRDYILYLETSMNPETKTGLNEIIILSLDETYQPINMQSLSYYMQEFQELKNPDVQFIKTNHTFSALSVKEDKLNIALTTINREDKFPGDIHLQYSKLDSELYFDEDGMINQIFND